MLTGINQSDNRGPLAMRLPAAGNTTQRQECHNAKGQLRCPIGFTFQPVGFRVIWRGRHWPLVRTDHRWYFSRLPRDSMCCVERSRKRGGYRLGNRRIRTPDFSGGAYGRRSFLPGLLRTPQLTGLGRAAA
jgi:hypothetical protein